MATWNPSDKSSHITLSSGDLVATKNDTVGAGTGAVRATRSFSSSDKKYWEITPSSSVDWIAPGVANANFVLSNFLGGDNDGISWFRDGAVVLGGSSLTNAATWATSDVLCIAFDGPNNKIHFRVNGGNWNNNASHDPATNTGGYSISAITGARYPVLYMENLNNAVTANFGASSFAQSVPSGFSAVNTYSLTCAQGSFALTGQAAGLKRGLKLAAAQGSFAFSGQDAALRAARRVAAAVGAFTFTGVAATLTKSGTGAYSLVCSTGAFSFTGVAAGLRAARKVAAAVGVFTLSGQAAAFVRARRIAVSAGSFAFSGIAASLKATRRLAVTAGSFVFTGRSATLTKALYQATLTVTPITSRPSLTVNAVSHSALTVSPVTRPTYTVSPTVSA